MKLKIHLNTTKSNYLIDIGRTWKIFTNSCDEIEQSTIDVARTDINKLIIFINTLVYRIAPMIPTLSYGVTYIFHSPWYRADSFSWYHQLNNFCKSITYSTRNIMIKFRRKYGVYILIFSSIQIGLCWQIGSTRVIRYFSQRDIISSRTVVNVLTTTRYSFIGTSASVLGQDFLAHCMYTTPTLLVQIVLVDNDILYHHLFQLSHHVHLNLVKFKCLLEYSKQ